MASSVYRARAHCSIHYLERIIPGQTPCDHKPNPFSGASVDALKIDRVFISDMSTNSDNYEIVRLIINLAHNIGLKVVAEGTEKEDQINELRRLGCEMAQGFLYSPPVSAEAAFGLLMRNYEGAFAT